MLLLVLAFAASLIMPLAIFFFLRNAHKDDPDYKNSCRNLLLKGLLLCFPVFGFSLLCNVVFKLLHIDNPVIHEIFRAFILMAFSEELMKYLFAKKTIKMYLSKVSFLDVMAYTAISAIGFELIEAFIYLFSTNVPQVLMRGVTSMHPAFGLVMGYIVAKGIKKNGKLSLMPAVLITTLFHGAYDFCLSPIVIDTDWAVLALLLAIICLVINIYNFFFMTKARKKTYYTEPLFPAEAEASEAEAAEPV